MEDRMSIPVKLDRSKLVRNLAKRNILAPHLDKVIGEGDFEWEYKYEPKVVDTAWHPSSHCTPSLNELYQIGSADPYAIGEDFSASLYKTFQVGHFWHQYLQFLVVEKLGFAEAIHIERKGEVEWDEKDKETRNIYPMSPTPDNVIRCRPFHWIGGSADIAPCEIPEHGPYLVDFKSVKARDFKSSAPPTWAADKWECQINIYMDLFGLEKALIFAIEKDSPHEFKEFEYHLNQPLVDVIYKKWKLVSSCLREEVEPPVDEDIDLPLKGPIKR
jgi:hypothetical protein